MDFETDDAKFESKLDETARKKAKEELNELNDEDRTIAVHTLRKWAKQQDWLKTPTDFGFLLRHLRVKKFSQLEARNCIENYWTAKTNSPSWFRDIDPADDMIQEIIRTGFYLCPKKYDKQGRRLVFIRLDKLDLDKINSKWGVDNICKVVFLIYDWLMLDENVQVNGIALFGDYTHVTMQLMMTIWTLDIAKRGIAFVQNSLPARLKALHFYNLPAFFDGIFQMMMPFFKPKIKDRIHLHGKSLVKIFEDCGMPIMLKEYQPDEYTGPSTGAVCDVAEEMIADMTSPEFRNYIKDLSSGRYGVDTHKRKADNTPAESFRKLHAD